MSIRNNDKMDETTRLKVTYEILKTTARFKYFKPCVKMYLYSHVRSSGWLIVKPKKWHTALTLPIARFQKASEAKVHSDSVAIIKK
jgi:hypothetical protein